MAMTSDFEILWSIYNTFDLFRPLSPGDSAYIECHAVGDDDILAELGREILLGDRVTHPLRFEQSPKPSKADKEKQGKSGFVAVKVRWVIERSNAWMEHCKILVKNFERTLDNAKTKLNLCFIRLMLKRLATS